jgi:hypothetical protein
MSYDNSGPDEARLGLWVVFDVVHPRDPVRPKYQR